MSRRSRALCLVACVLINGQVWGNAYSFHVLFSHLSKERPLQAGHASLVGSLTFGCVLFFSVFVSPFLRRVRLLWLTLAACGLGAAGPALSAFTSDLRLWYATWVLPLSLSGAAFFTLGFCVASAQFPRHAYLVCALVSSSACAFSLLLPPVWQWGLTALGLRTSLLVYSAWFGVLLPASVLMPRRFDAPSGRGEGERRRGTFLRSLCQRDLVVWTSSLLLAAVMFYCPFVHITRLAHEALVDSGHSQQTVTTAVSAMLSVGSVVSKVVIAVLCHRQVVSGVRLFQLGLLSYALSQVGLALMLLLCSKASFGLLLLLCGLMGAGEGPYFSLLLPVTQEVSPGSDPTVFTLVCAVIAFPLSLGGPMGEWLYRVTGGYTISCLLTGLAFMGAADLLLLIRHRRKTDLEEMAAQLEEELEMTKDEGRWEMGDEEEIVKLKESDSSVDVNMN